MVGAGLVKGGLHVGLLFVCPAAGLCAQQPDGGEARGFIEPAGEHGAGAQAGGFAGENDEDGLRHVLRIARVAGETERHGIDEVDVAPHQLGKGRLGIVAGEFPHQVHVVRVCHLSIIPDRRRNWTIIFESGWFRAVRGGGGKLPATPALRATCP